jgi:S-adenosylmethionine synthetase
MDRRHLNELAMKMTGAGKVVDDIKILTWSDRKVDNDKDSTNTEIILARQRAESIKNYLERNLPAEEDIDFYNMAENPERYSSYLTRKGVPIEQAFNEQGSHGPESRALVIIEYQSGPMPSSL